ncbi:LLM class flavin-dependent oxidoreductase [Nocardioides convexus]|uniref:LLM class flavin-dependent oxidoreductase n=1 Tax=Nocardioides convexus TaxID=2712224 RepID=UPI002418A6E2|nr:LLM class flavin-dependent oxidoreductase [Nocardioides convexus]
MTPYASMVEWTAVHRLWQGQSVVIEPHQAFAHAAGAGLRIPLGLAVTLMPLRHPFEAAVQAASLARTTGQPLVAGYGPGPKPVPADAARQALREPGSAPCGSTSPRCAGC